MQLTIRSLPLCLALPLFGSNAVAGDGFESDSEAISTRSEDHAAIETAFHKAMLVPRATEFGFSLRNQSQSINAELNGDDFSVTSQDGAWAWGLALQSFGFEGTRRVVQEATSMEAGSNRVTYHWTPTLDEWYVNDNRGIEHGYTLSARPSGAGAGLPLTFDLDVLGELLPTVSADGRSVGFSSNGGAAQVNYSGLTVFDANGETLRAQFERIDDDLRITIDEAGACYPITIDPIIQQAYLKASNPGTVDHFGYSVAISGDTAVIGADQEDSAANGVNGDESDNSAHSSGAAYIFVRNGKTWTQQAYLKAFNSGEFDHFGGSVSISGDTVVVGAHGEKSAGMGVNGNPFDNSLFHAGAAYVFERSGSSWSQTAYLKASNTGDGDQFGSEVSIDGDFLLVGAPQEDSAATGIGGNQADDSETRSGAAYLFHRNGSTWSQVAYLKATASNEYDRFGDAVAVSGNTFVVGAPSEDSNAQGIDGDATDNSAPASGAAYIFRLNEDVFFQDAYLKASNADDLDTFGQSVSVFGDTVVIGAPHEDSNSKGVNGDQSDNSALGTGAVYVFEYDGANWSQDAYLKASNSDASDAFGWEVATNGDRILVSAVNEQAGIQSMHVDGSDNSAPIAGAAYAFKRAPMKWNEEAYLKASNAGFEDRFGWSLAFDGSTVLVGAPFEDSKATGVDGDQTDNSVHNAGAVYAYDLESQSGFKKYGRNLETNIAVLDCFDAPDPGSFILLETAGFNGDGLAHLMISAASANTPFLGGTLFVDPLLSVTGPGGMTPFPVFAGEGALMIPVYPAAAGLTFYAQAVMADPLQPFGFAMTNGLLMGIGL